jgi:hypothetical protein
MMNAKLFMAAAAAAAALALAACGGGGDSRNDDDGDDTVPASALASPESFSRYVGGLRATEEKEPLSLVDVAPPTSETDGEIDVD